MTDEQRGWIQRVLGLSPQGGASQDDAAEEDQAPEDQAPDDQAPENQAPENQTQGDPGNSAPATDAEPPPAFDPTAGGAFAQASQAWRTTRTQITGDLDKLHGAFAAAFKDHDSGPEIEKAFRARVDALLDGMNETLSHKLDEAQKATDQAQHAKLLDEVRAIVQRHQAQAASDPTILALDANPFMPLQIGRTLTQTFAAFSI